jgi:hypothetical protein
MAMRFRATSRRSWLAGTLLLVVLAGCSFETSRPTSARTSTVRFAQLTDPHIFDAGKPRQAQTRTAAEKESAEAVEAFEWALQELNEPKNQGLDFVVITGDFGLEMVSIALRKQSAEYLAEELAKLKTVETILLVPGNNDLLDERHEYIGVYNAFVDEVRSHLVARGKNKTIVNLIKGSHAPPRLGLVVVGLESATFRNKECGATVTQPPKPQCPAVWDYQTEEMNRVRKELAKGEGTPAIVFTHIPNLYDPHDLDGGKRAQSWVLHQDTWHVWDDDIAKILNAVFAGHFHSQNIQDYGQPQRLIPPGHPSTRSTPTKEPAFVVCPPLSPKFQVNEQIPKSQGYLIGEIDTKNRIIDYRIIYKNGNPRSGKVDLH